MATLHAFFKPLGKSSNGTPSRKRPRSRILDSDSDEETVAVKSPPVDNVTPAKSAKVASNSDSSLETTPKKQQPLSSTMTPKSANLTCLTPSTPLTPITSQGLAQCEGSEFSHERLEWLLEDKIQDASGRSKDHPDYDPKTLQVPLSFLNKKTPAQRQWWEMKSTHFDTILMFKVGKFYEMYHMDAVTGVRECGLVFMKGDMAHCGFPELGFGKYSQMLVQKGYKVARVEQTESPAMMEERIRQSSGKVSKFERVVRREICSVVSKGTQVPLYQDRGRKEADHLYLLAVKEQGLEYGVCFVDTSIGTFHLGQFDDDDHGSRLRTLCAHHPPAHVIHERGQTSLRTTGILKQVLAGTVQDQLTPGSEFWSAEKAVEELVLCLEAWPAALEYTLDKDYPGKRVAKRGWSLAVSALGACLWELHRSCIDTELLSINNFQLYTPLDMQPTAESAPFTNQRMILDDVTLTNLDLVDTHGKPAGTLLDKIDHTVTAFGKRLMREWVCAPLCDPNAINARQEAVADLIGHAHLIKEARAVLEKLPDLERKIRKFHMLGCPGDHPDRRALFYDHVIYSKQKIADFIAVLEGFERCTAILSLFQSELPNFNSALLRQCVSLKGEGGGFPCLQGQLSFFQSSFDKQEALQAGVIVPSAGVNKRYDEALAGIKTVQTQLTDYLTEQRCSLQVKGLSFVGSGRSRYQLEVPEGKCSKLPPSYELKGQRRGYRRYTTMKSEDLLERLVQWEEERDTALKENMTWLFHSFDQHFEQWQGAVECLASLDSLLSLAEYSSHSDMCRPQVVTPADKPFLILKEGRHPCLLATFSGDEFIPNDVTIDERSCVVVTGPNMGGKSTFMRQTALIVILAQIGSFVPAKSCQLSPVDRVFTRIGASDRITAGESTFFVELKETATILQHATRHSLVLLDELGRGTSTYDGTAIAWAVLAGLSRELACRCFFSTHYHSLVEELSQESNITLGHMACLVEQDSVGEERVIFLYKFVEGMCPHSYGFNVAHMAGIPEQIVSLARKKAATFESKAIELQEFRKMFSP